MGDSTDDPAELAYIFLEGGTEVDLPVGGPMAAGSPLGLDDLLDSLHRVSTSEGDCPLEKMTELDLLFISPLALGNTQKLTKLALNLLCRGIGHDLAVLFKVAVFGGLRFCPNQKPASIVSHHGFSHNGSDRPD